MSFLFIWLWGSSTGSHLHYNIIKHQKRNLSSCWPPFDNNVNLKTFLDPAHLCSHLTWQNEAGYSLLCLRIRSHLRTLLTHCVSANVFAYVWSWAGLRLGQPTPQTGFSPAGIVCVCNAFAFSIDTGSLGKVYANANASLTRTHYWIHHTGTVLNRFRMQTQIHHIHKSEHSSGYPA